MVHLKGILVNSVVVLEINGYARGLQTNQQNTKAFKTMLYHRRITEQNQLVLGRISQFAGLKGKTIQQNTIFKTGGKK